MKHLVVAALAVLAAAVIAPAALADAPCSTSSISSNFNGTQINGGSWIWFNAVVDVKNPGAGPVTIGFDQQKISFSAGGTSYTVTPPDSSLTVAASNPTADTVWDAVGNRWVTTAPLSTSGNYFLAGFAYHVPAGGFPGGINPVTWSGQFSSSTGTATLSWKWAAAAYTQFSADNAQIGVKAVDDGSQSPYKNSDHAGTPENERGWVTGGARGGGGANFTGSYSGTLDASVTCLPPPTDVCPNIDGVQTSVPAGMVKDASGNCVTPPTDVCPNIDGVQTSVPAGMVKDASGNCVTPPTDVCPNIDGVQTSVPAGMVKDASGNCVTPPTDVCPNIDGVQTSVPAGMVKDASGNCVTPPTDVCPNIEGVQTSVPSGMSKDASGNCVTPPVTVKQVIVKKVVVKAKPKPKVVKKKTKAKVKVKAVKKVLKPRVLPHTR